MVTSGQVQATVLPPQHYVNMRKSIKLNLFHFLVLCAIIFVTFKKIIIIKSNCDKLTKLHYIYMSTNKLSLRSVKKWTHQQILQHNNSQQIKDDKFVLCNLCDSIIKYRNYNRHLFLNHHFWL